MNAGFRAASFGFRNYTYGRMRVLLKPSFAQRILAHGWADVARLRNGIANSKSIGDTLSQYHLACLNFPFLN